MKYIMRWLKQAHSPIYLKGYILRLQRPYLIGVNDVEFRGFQILRYTVELSSIFIIKF